MLLILKVSDGRWYIKKNSEEHSLASSKVTLYRRAILVCGPQRRHCAQQFQYGTEVISSSSIAHICVPSLTQPTQYSYIYTYSRTHLPTSTRISVWSSQSQAPKSYLRQLMYLVARLRILSTQICFVHTEACIFIKKNEFCSVRLYLQPFLRFLT